MLPIRGGLMTDWDPWSHVTWAVAMNGLSHEPCGVVRSIDSFLSEHMHYFTKLKQRLRLFWRPLTRFLQFVRGVQEISVKCFQTFLNPAPAFCFKKFWNSESVLLWQWHFFMWNSQIRDHLRGLSCSSQSIYLFSLSDCLSGGLWTLCRLAHDRKSFDLFSVIGAKTSESCWVWEGVTLSSVFCVDNLNSIYLNTKMMHF